MQKPNVNPQEIYTIAETCHQLGIDRRTLRRWTTAGSIKAHVRKCDKQIVYLGADIDKCYYSII